jgi:hypothetical protein
MSYYTSNLGNKSVYTSMVGTPISTVYAAAKSRLRIVHNVANGPKVDGFLDGKAALRDVPYKSISDYLEVTSGSHIVTVKVSGSETIIVDGEIDLVPGVGYTLIVHGLITDLKSIAPLLVDDSLTCPSHGKAHVRFIHAAAGAPAVDIYAGNVRIFDNVSYGQLSTPEYLPVMAGHINLSVTTAASVNISADIKRVLGPIPLRLANGGIYTIIASGLVGNAECPLTALVSEDTKGACIITNM